MAAPRKLEGALLAKARELLDEDGATQRGVAETLGISQSGLSRALARERDPEAPGEPTVEITGEDWRVFHGLTVEDLADADAMLRRRGFSPDDWEVTRASMTEWGRDPETGAPFQRLKVDVRRRLSLLSLLPGGLEVRPLPQLPEPDPTKPQRGVIFADPHFPYVDEDLHLAALAFLRDVPLDFGVLAGDTADFPNPSRHRRNPKFNASPQTCVDAATQGVEDYTRARAMRWLKLLGNHDVRIRNFLLESSAPELATLRPGRLKQDPEPDVTPALAVRRLLQLDALGVECVEPEGEYGDELLYVSPKLGIIHGERTGKNPGAAELERYGHSIGFGHTHRKSTSYRTTWDSKGGGVGPYIAGAHHNAPREVATTHLAFEVGCMCRIQGGLGYTRRPDWQNGFGVVTVWPDGTFNVEHATWTAGRLLWRDEVWKP